MLAPSHNFTLKAHVKSGLAFGLTQFTTYIIIGLMFLFGGIIMENSFDEKTGKMTILPENLFIALFAIMFGASHAGSAAAMGPDQAKAQAAADRIFKIRDFPSKINAVEIDKDTTKTRLDLSSV